MNATQEKAKGLKKGVSFDVNVEEASSNKIPIKLPLRQLTQFHKNDRPPSALKDKTSSSIDDFAPTPITITTNNNNINNDFLSISPTQVSQKPDFVPKL